MAQLLRRRIYNYTVLTLDKEGSITDFEIFSAAAIRVRDGKEVATYLCPDFPTDAKKRTEEVNRLRTFIGNDMVITCDISGMTPVMESLYMNSIEAFFTNATLDLLTVEEEVEKSVPDPKPFHERMSHFRRVVEPLERARGMREIYEEDAKALFGYQEGYPYWLCSLPYEEERYMAKRLPSKRKKFWKALLCWMVGCHYFYLGHPRRNILYLLTLGGCFLWMLSDLYRLPVLLDVENGRIAAEVYKTAPKVNRPSIIRWAPYTGEDSADEGGRRGLMSGLMHFFR